MFGFTCTLILLTGFDPNPMGQDSNVIKICMLGSTCTLILLKGFDPKPIGQDSKVSKIDMMGFTCTTIPHNYLPLFLYQQTNYLAQGI